MPRAEAPSLRAHRNKEASLTPTYATTPQVSTPSGSTEPLLKNTRSELTPETDGHTNGQYRPVFLVEECRCPRGHDGGEEYHQEVDHRVGKEQRRHERDHLKGTRPTPREKGDPKACVKGWNWASPSISLTFTLTFILEQRLWANPQHKEENDCVSEALLM